MKILQWPQVLQKNMVISIPAFMLAGFLAGLIWDVHGLEKAVVPLTFLMVYPTMIGLNFKQAISGNDAKLQGVTQAFNFLAMPLIAYLLGLWFFKEDPMLRLGLFMTGLLPTSGMTLNWTSVAKGNLPSAVKMTIIGLVAGSLLAPFYMQFAFGKSIALPLSKTLSQVALVVFLPMLLGFLTQKILVANVGKDRFQKELKPLIGPWGTVGVLGVMFSAMALKAELLVAKPQLLVAYGIPMLVFYLLNFGLSTWLARYFDSRADGIAFIYGTALRNLSIALAIVMTVLGKQGADVAILVSIGFIFQSQLAAWHVRYLDRLLPARAVKVAFPLERA